MNSRSYGVARGTRETRKSYPRFCVVTYRGRVFISREEIPANTSITDDRWIQLANAYNMMHRSKEVS